MTVANPPPDPRRIQEMKRERSWFERRWAMTGWRAALGLCLASAIPAGAQAADAPTAREWRLTPRLGVGAAYSDNINLAPNDPAESDLVFQVEPGVSIRKRGGRLDLRLDYTAQGLLYADHGDADQIHHQLLTFGTAELYQDHLFLDAFGSIERVPVTSGGRVDAGGLGAGAGLEMGERLFGDLRLGLPGSPELFQPNGLFSDLALTGNQVTANRFGLSPYWRQNLGGWGEALLRYRYEEVRYDRNEDGLAEASPQPVDLFDSRTNTIELNVNNRRKASTLLWNLDYSHQREESQGQEAQSVDSEEDRRERMAGRLAYRWNPRWSLLAEAGYENNTLTTFDANRTGGYWGLGGAWTPNRFMTLSGLYGLNVNEVAWQWNPSARTNLRVRRRDQQVGVSPGVHWEGVFNHRSRYGVWRASYTEEVTNSQQLLNTGLTGDGTDGRQPIPGSEGSFGLSDQDFLRKRFEAGLSYQRRRHGVGLNAFHESREFQDTTKDETGYGLGVLWTWRFAPRTASFLGTGWEHNAVGDGQQNDYWVSVIGLARVLTPDIGALISYRYYQNDADPGEQGFRENRFNVRVNVKF